MTFEGHGVSQIRGLNISKLLKGFADEEFFFKSLVTVVNTPNREIRWYKRESGVLDTTDSDGMTASRIKAGAELALPEVIEQKVERQSSQVLIFDAMSPWISNEDISDSDVQILALNTRQIPRAITKAMNDHIYNVMTEDQSATDILSTASTAAWSAGSGVKIVTDIETGKRKIRAENYEPTHIFLSPLDYQNMIIEFSETRATGFTAFASANLTNGARIVGTILGLQVVVSNSVAADSAAIAAPRQAVTYYEFYDLRADIEESKAINAVRVIARASGKAVLTDPKAVHLTTNTE